MQRLMLRPVSCSFQPKTQSPSKISTHFPSLYSKHRNTLLNFKLMSPRVVSEENDYLVLQRNHGEVVYELMNKREAEKRQIVQEDIPTGDSSTSHVENTLRWQFICRVYAILATQISFCVVVVSTIICLCVPVKQLLSKIHPVTAFAVAILPFICKFPCNSLLFTPRVPNCAVLTNFSIIVSWPLAVYRKQSPMNIVLLVIVTVCVSIDIAICCAAMKVEKVLQALLVTMAGVSSLTGYTFWASKQGKSFSYLRPFLSSCLSILIVTGILQLFFPLVSKGNAIYAGLVAMVVSGYLVYDTDSMIKHYKYNEHIAASVSVFLDMVIFFLSNLDLLQYCADFFS